MCRHVGWFTSNMSTQKKTSVTALLKHHLHIQIPIMASYVGLKNNTGMLWQLQLVVTVEYFDYMYFIVWLLLLSSYRVPQSYSTATPTFSSHNIAVLYETYQTGHRNLDVYFLLLIFWLPCVLFPILSISTKMAEQVITQVPTYRWTQHT